MRECEGGREVRRCLYIHYRCNVSVSTADQRRGSAFGEAEFKLVMERGVERVIGFR